MCAASQATIPAAVPCSTAYPTGAMQGISAATLAMQPRGGAAAQWARPGKQQAGEGKGAQAGRAGRGSPRRVCHGVVVHGGHRLQLELKHRLGGAHGAGVRLRARGACGAAARAVGTRRAGDGPSEPRARGRRQSNAGGS